jgi:tetratricopeptide (TPR) repeat protein
MGRTHHLADATGQPAGGVAVPRTSRLPRVPRTLAFLGAALLLAAGTYVAPAIREALVGRAVVPPAKTVLAVPGQATSPDGRLPIADRIAFWTKRVTEQPADDVSWLQLAAVYSEQGRLHVDLDAYARALDAANHALAIAPKYPPSLAVHASILFATHDFAGAEADARAALVNNPRDPTARAVLGDALLELGRPSEAAAEYAAIADVAGGPSLDIRRARLAYVTGHPADALTLARKALEGASGGLDKASATSDPLELAFYQAALGEYARLSGDAATADVAFRTALELRPDDLASRIGLARVSASAGDTDSAIRLLEEAAAIAPLPEIEALLGDIHALRGEGAAADAAYDTVRLTAQLSELAGTVFDRQLILFDLDHGSVSSAVLARAEAAFDVRPDAVGQDVVGWALHRLGREDEAWAASAAARATGITDARLLFHAGAIALARGDAALGEALLLQALDLGPALDPMDRTEAEALLAGS